MHLALADFATLHVHYNIETVVNSVYNGFFPNAKLLAVAVNQNNFENIIYNTAC